MTRKLLATAFVTAATLGGAYWMTSAPEATSSLLPAPAMAQEADAATDAATEAPAIVDMMMGQADAPVEVIEYASFTCPHCKNFHDGPLPEIKKNYIDEGKVKFIFREVYFDRPGLWASMVARCGGEMRYFGISDLIFENQSEWAKASGAAEMVDMLKKYGKIAGLEDAQLDACLQDATTAQALVDWYQANDAVHDITGTPSFIINGEKYSNMSYTDFAAVLDNKLAEAK